MFSLKSILRESKTLFYQSFVNHRVPIQFGKGIISISFDDVPRSAFINAVPILDKYDIKSTFYVSTGLSVSADITTKNRGDTFLNRSDIIELHQTGHNIACHTYSHYRLNEGSAERLYEDSEKNSINLTEMLDGVAIEHFSYPFGLVSFRTKRLLAQRYKSMRSSRPGINKTMTDLYLLRAMSLYKPEFSKESIVNIIRQVEITGGWLILYTHGVETSPDDYGCTIEQFEWVVRQCVASSACVVPINQAYEMILDI